MKNPAKAQPFFWEMTVVLLFFALSAAVVLRLFVAGSTISRTSAAQNAAQLAVQSAAETIAASDEPTIRFPDGLLAPDGEYCTNYGEQDADTLKISAHAAVRKTGILCWYHLTAFDADGAEQFSLDTAKYFAGEE